MPDIAALETGIKKGDRAMLGRAITLVESRRSDHLAQAQELLSRLLPFTGKARRSVSPAFREWGSLPLSTPSAAI
nr:hypothetical protein [Iodidimonas gelatinilytica]